MFHAKLPWNFDYRRVVLDEVALEGLDGIGIHGLWARLEHRLSLKLTDRLKSQVWSTLLKSRNSIAFFKLPVPAPEVTIVNRFSWDNEKSVFGEVKDGIDGPYVYSPVSNNLVIGSCQYYNERKEIPHAVLQALSYEKALERWGKKLVVVASREERWHAIAPNSPMCCCEPLQIAHYCLLELIGRARENGITTTGQTNITKIIKESKTLHYLKKMLIEFKLITSKIYFLKSADKSILSNLLRLTRFTVPKIVTLPKSGNVYLLITRLQSMPEQMESFVSAAKALNIDPRLMKKFLGRSDVAQFFKVKEAKPLYGKVKNNKKGKAIVQRAVQLDIHSDESAGSEGEEREAPAEGEEDQVEPQYQVGVGLVRQAYQRIAESGTRGLTQMELAKILNINFHGSRHILRVLNTSNTLRHILVDKGRQRTKRYVTIASMRDNNSHLAHEKQKLLQYLRNAPELAVDPSAGSKVGTRPDHAGWSAENAVVEVRQLKEITPQISFSKMFKMKGKQPSLRQLIAINTIIELINEKQVIQGIRELNVLVHKRTGQDIMDSKTMKRILQKLIDDNLLRYYKVQGPGSSKHHQTTFLCAPHVTASHPSIMTNYRDICLRAYRSSHVPNKIIKLDLPMETVERDFFFPKYTRARKLHEFLFHLVYEKEDGIYDDDLPPGCFNLVNIIPEMTVDMILGHTRTKNAPLIQLASNSHLLTLKVRHSSDEICRTLFGSATPILTLKKTIYMLAAFGLVQCCDETCLHVDGATQVDRCIYYVNRNAKIIDTSGTWPNPDREPVEHRYHFANLDNVSEFWSALHNTCTNTMFTTAPSTERATEPSVSLSRLDEAAALDDGNRAVGDGRGAGGFDSNYHPEIPRLWYSNFKDVATKAGVKRKLLDMKNFPPRSQFQKKRPKLSRNETTKAMPKKKLPKPTRTVAAKSLPNKPGKDHRTLKRKRSMTLLRWSKLQDKIIIWSRVAKTLMSPAATPGALQVANIVARDVISRVSDARKACTCHRRALALRRDTAVLKTETRLAGELRRHPAIMEKYGGLCRKLRMKHLGQFNRYLNEAHLRMTELVWTIANLSKLRGYDHSLPCIATNLSDLRAQFSFKYTDRTMMKESYSNIGDIQFGTLTEAVLQTMNSLIDGVCSVDRSMMIYGVFENYPDSQLRPVILELRRAGVVARQDKNLASNFKKITSKEAVSYTTTFKLSAAYVRRWKNLLSSSFPDRIANALQVMVPSDDVDSTSHTSCILLEFSAMGNVEIFLTKKPTVQTLGGLAEPDMALIEVDEKVSVKMQRGKVGWRWKNNSVDRFKDLFDDIALTNEISLICRKSLVVPPAEQDKVDVDDAILKYLDQKGELGATFQELFVACDMPSEILRDNLKKLEGKRIIRKMGFNDNRIVLWKHIEPWMIPIDTDCVIPSPWITIGKKLNLRSFVGWCATIMLTVYDRPGCSIAKIAELCEFNLSPRNVGEMCTLLASTSCVEMKRIICEEVGLFANDEKEIRMDDSYEFEDPEKILVFPMTDSFIRFSLVKKKLCEYQECEGS